MSDSAKRFREAFDRATAENPNFPDRERLQFALIDSANWAREIIHLLHVRGIAEAGAWSPLLPAPYPYEVMSILTRYRARS